MNKFKKIFTSFCMFFTSMISKVLAFDATTIIETKYGVFERNLIEDKYNVLDPQIIVEEKSGIGKIVLPLILFVIGIFVIISKKMTKKVKIIVVSILFALGVLGILLMKYLDNF